MREELNYSLLVKAPVLILGIGLIAPLLANGTLRDNLFLGLAAICALAASNALIAALCPRLPKNAQIGSAILIGGIVLTIAKIASAAVPAAGAVRIETLVPILLVTAIMKVETEAFVIKRRIVPALLDGGGIGLAFTLFLCLFGFLRDRIIKSALVKSGPGNGFEPFGFFDTLPGIFLLVAFIVLAAGIASQRKKKGPV